MKKIWITITAIVLFSPTIFAQNRIGITLGTGVSKMDNYLLYFHNDPAKTQHNIADNSYENLFSWNGGLYFYTSFNKQPIELGGEVQLNCMGAYNTWETPIYEDSTFHKLSTYAERLIYISIPLKINYSINNCWYVQAGLTSNILLSKQKGMYNQSNPKPLDFGANLGLCFRIFPKINFEIQAYHGIWRMNLKQDFEEDNPQQDFRLFNSSLTVALKYELWKGK